MEQLPERRVTVALDPDRRTAVAAAVILAWAALEPAAWAQGTTFIPERRWFEAAEEMKRRAESWGDQPYGAVLVLDGRVVGEGPSRVIKHHNPDAHAEREAIRDARERLDRQDLTGAVLYATSRPCRLCEAAAARAGVRRMVFGPQLTDAGPPRLSPQ